MLKNVKMSTIVGIFTFMSRIDFVLSRVEHDFFYNLGARPQGYKTFFMLNSTSEYEFIPLINIKMPTIVGILTFINRINTTFESFEARNMVTFQH